MDRIDMYLQWAVKDHYVNTQEEQELVTKFVALYAMAKSARDSNELSNPENMNKWRKAYYGTLGALNADGTLSKRNSKQLRKLVYELVESKIDNTVPLPKMSPRYKSDLPLVEVTENYIKYESDRIYTKYVNDRSERSTYVDGTSWYKVWWDSLDTSYNRSGNVKVDVCLADQIIPQPGVIDYRKLEYIFELQQLSLSRIYDTYGRVITPTSGDTSNIDPKQTDLSTITIINCYYLNEDRIVGRFSWSKNSMQVICNEKDWQIRKLRTCTKCGSIQPQSEVCPICGSKSFKFKNATKEILEQDLQVIYNPYDVDETDDEAEKDHYQAKLFLSKGTEIPFYNVRQLPFVPRPAVSSIETLYGVSEVFILLEMQDSINKMLTKAEDKTLKSGSILTKPRQVKINNTDDSFKILDVTGSEQAAMVQSKQILADTNQDIILAQLLYESARASSGVTDSFQGKSDSSATSGKAKEFSAAQTAGRIESLRVMKAAAFAGMYELVLKYLLAFSDESRKFVKILPDGAAQEQCWNKYMFLEKDKYGQIYYRDDFSFNSDPAATLSQNRVAMWQETQDKFINGALGDPAQPRTLELYWNLMEQQQYPLSRLALAGIKANAQHLPAEVEQMLVQNPQLLQIAMQLMEEQAGGPGSGGARPNSGPDGNGATHAANVERTNERNRSEVKDAIVAEQGGGVA